jgi:predicted flap endonuclease-1-like 5' DNA nuclease
LLAWFSGFKFKDSYMSGFDCCYWWFLAGAVLGWILNWMLSKLMRKDDSGSSSGSSSGKRRRRSSSNSESRASSSSFLASDHAEILNSDSYTAKREADIFSTKAAAAGSTPSQGWSGGADTILAALEGFTITGNDSFEIIEGIGPKISDLFKASGTNTFAQLAALSQSDMRKVLENGGSHFKLANPSTWAQQARMCHENRWIELRNLQKTLDGGVAKS